MYYSYDTQYSVNAFGLFFANQANSIDFSNDHCMDSIPTDACSWQENVIRCLPRSSHIEVLMMLSLEFVACGVTFAICDSVLNSHRTSAFSRALTLSNQLRLLHACEHEYMNMPSFNNSSTTPLTLASYRVCVDALKLINATSHIALAFPSP